MCRKWKRAAALGLTVLLGCMMPMSTMLAAEDNVETEAASVSDNDVSDEMRLFRTRSTFPIMKRPQLVRRAQMRGTRTLRMMGMPTCRRWPVF